jgi:hypothetical protein
MRSVIHYLAMPRLRTARFCLLWLGIGLHLLTVFTAYRLGGWLEAGLSFLFPIAAQVYWILDIWERTGTFFNYLTLLCLSYALAWPLCALMRDRGKT